MVRLMSYGEVHKGNCTQGPQWPNTVYSAAVIGMSSPCMDLLPDTQLRMRREYRERFPRHRLQRKPLVNDPGMHHGTCVTHVPWCTSGSLTRGGGENVPGIPGACATRNLVYLARDPLLLVDVMGSSCVARPLPYPTSRGFLGLTKV